jgi:uncharacterized protein
MTLTLPTLDMTLGKPTMILTADDPLAGEVVRAVKGGDLDSLKRLLSANPRLSNARITDNRGGSRTLLHLVTDWPGFFPNGPAVVKLLIAAGSHPDGKPEPREPQSQSDGETPLHWAASSDDVEVAEALLVGGADIEARGGSIAGGTPLENAIGYGCWRVARLLVNRGAKVEKLWHAAALGMTDTVERFFQQDPIPSSEELNSAFWQACSGGYRRTAEYLLARGADLNWVPDYAKGTPLDIATTAGMDTGRQALVSWLRDKGAQPQGK